MATRFYLPSSGDSPLPELGIHADWDDTHASFFRAPTATTKSDTALTDFSDYFASTSSQQMCYAQWASDYVLAANVDFAPTDTADAVVRTLEEDAATDAYLACIVRVVSGDGATDRGTALSYGITGGSGTEFSLTTPSTVRFVSAAMGTVSALAGDRIVIEMGAYGWTPATIYYHLLRFGDPTAASDFALTGGLTTDLCPWVQVSKTVTLEPVGGLVSAPNMDLMRGMW